MPGKWEYQRGGRCWGETIKEREKLKTTKYRFSSARRKNSTTSTAPTWGNEWKKRLKKRPL